MAENTIEPVALPAPSTEPVEVAMVTLFSIGDKEYQVPKKPSATVSLKYLRDVRNHGEETAAANLIAVLLGEEGFEALCDYEDLTDEQWEAIQSAAQKHVVGSREKANRGNGGRGSKR